MMKSVLVAVERLKTISKYKTKLRRTKKFMVSKDIASFIFADRITKRASEYSLGQNH